MAENDSSKSLHQLRDEWEELKLTWEGLRQDAIRRMDEVSGARARRGIANAQAHIEDLEKRLADSL